MDSRVLEGVREDDFVEYYLFPQCGTLTEKEQDEFLSDISEKCSRIVNEITKDHLWHKDKFTLLPRTTITNKLVNLDDKNGEWLILISFHIISVFFRKFSSSLIRSHSFR